MSPRNPELQEVLEPQHREAGLCLEEPDDHVLFLKHEEEIVAIFSQEGATQEQIRLRADYFLVGW